MVPAVAQFALGVTVPACVTVDAAVGATAPVARVKVAPAAAVAVPVFVTRPEKAAVCHVNNARNKNTLVPCSVTAGVAGVRVVIGVCVAPLPILTWLKVEPGPNPAAVAVNTVPYGPEVGEIVSVGAFKAQAVVATLPKLSVKVNDVPAVIAGRLTVPVYSPAVMAFELKVAAEAVTVPAANASAVPAKVAAVIA
jgi:hypothetical protein